MALFQKDIFLHSPYFMYVVGKSREGKTYFINEIVDKTDDKTKIIYVVNRAFDIEPEIIERMKKNKNIYVIRAGDLSDVTIKFLTDTLKTSKDKKLIIVDNFTYQLSLSFLNFVTFARKYNADTIFISHTLNANDKISPRLKEVTSYFVFFYLPDSHSYKKILPQDLYKDYTEQILHKSYKFLLYDIQESEYVIGKLPDYKIRLNYQNEFKDKYKKTYALIEKLNDFKESEAGKNRS